MHLIRTASLSCEAPPPFCSATLQGRVHEAKASHYTRQNILVLMLVLKYQDQIAKVKKQNDNLKCKILPTSLRTSSAIPADSPGQIWREGVRGRGKPKTNSKIKD